MRTTITLDDDLYQMLANQSRKLSVSFKQIVNDTLRNGMGNIGKPPIKKRYRIKTFRSGLQPGIDPTKLNQLVDDMEIDYFLEKMRRSA